MSEKKSQRKKVKPGLSPRFKWSPGDYHVVDRKKLRFPGDDFTEDDLKSIDKGVIDAFLNN